MKNNFDDLLENCHSRLNHLFLLYVKNKHCSSPRLQEAMRHLLHEGKHFRALLVYATGISLDAAWESLDAPACAVELIHTYSLIHDDLPAMDNADVRRGKLSCHKAYDEALAILAGDALQPLAFEILATHPAPLSDAQRLSMIQTLANACGFMGMVAGQAMDIAEIHDLESLKEMYALKTGALIQASVTLGIIAANHEDPVLKTSLAQFSKQLGLAFQIQDDLLDIEKSTSITGKPKGLDKENKKRTYPVFMGVEDSRKVVHQLFSQISQQLNELAEKAAILRPLSNYILNREK